MQSHVQLCMHPIMASALQCAFLRLWLAAGWGRHYMQGLHYWATTMMPAGLLGCSATYHLLYLACQVMQGRLQEALQLSVC